MYQANISDIKFYIQNDRSKGICYIEFECKENVYAAYTQYKISGSVTSCYVQPFDGMCIKAFISIDCNDLNASKFIDYMKEAKKIDCNRDMRLSYCGVYGDVHLFVYAFQEKQNGHYVTDPRTYDRYIVFPTKALAIRGVLEQLNRVINIGGLKIVNLDCVDESVVSEFGFECISDELNKMQPMYIGKPDDILNLARGAMYYNHEKDVSNSKSILEMIQAEISS